ncbi:MAG: hypothetical protein AAF067_12600, partial [Pseudomonadota bacterium]
GESRRKRGYEEEDDADAGNDDDDDAAALGGRLFEEEYEVVLAVDSREKRRNGTNECEAMLGMLQSTWKIAQCARRVLDVADYCWLASPRGMMASISSSAA